MQNYAISRQEYKPGKYFCELFYGDVGLLVYTGTLWPMGISLMWLGWFEIAFAAVPPLETFGATHLFTIPRRQLIVCARVWQL